MTSPRRPLLLTLLQNLLLVGASFVFALLVGEVALRLTGHAPLSHGNPGGAGMFWEYDATLGWRNQPNRSPEDFRGAFFPVRTDAHGLRGTPHEYARIAGARRIVLLGDSFAWGWGVADSGSLCRQLERRLAACEVVNAGVPGYSSDQELLWLEREGVKYRPDLVLLQFCANDEGGNLEASHGMYSKPYFQLDGEGRLVLGGVPVPRASWVRRCAFWLFDKTSIGAVAQRGLRGLYKRMTRPRGAAPATAPNGSAAAAAAPGAEHPYALTMAILDQMRRTAASCGARMLIVIGGRRQWEALSGNIDEEIAAMRAAGFEVVDPELDPGYDPGHMLCLDRFHWNEIGHGFAAGMVAAAIERDGYLPAPAAVASK